MTRMALWQKWLYHGGEVLMVAGILWAAYRTFVLRTCPIHWYNDITLIAFGLFVSVLPLHPFGAPGYIAPWLRRSAPIAVVFWLLTVAGTAYALYSRVRMQPGWYWAAALAPAILYLWFGIASKLSDSPLPRRAADQGKEGRDA